MKRFYFTYKFNDQSLQDGIDAKSDYLELIENSSQSVAIEQDSEFKCQQTAHTKYFHITRTSLIQTNRCSKRTEVEI